MSNRHEFQAMFVFCQDVPTHEHEGWGYDYDKRCFNTAKEAEYPAGMCRRYAQVLGEFLDVGLLQPKLPRMLPQAQPKGRKLPQLIPEFLDVVTCLLAEVPQVDAKKNIVHDVGAVPKGSRLLRAEANKGNTGRFLCVFGIFRSMEQFVMCAKTLWHPFDELRNLPDAMTRCLFSNLTETSWQNQGASS